MPGGRSLPRSVQVAVMGVTFTSLDETRGRMGFDEIIVGGQNMSDNEEILRRAASNYNDPPNRERYFDLYAEHAVLHGYEGVEPGLPSIRRHYRAQWEAFPDVRLTVEEVFSADDRLACRFSIEGTHQGPFRGIPATGKRVRYPG